MNSAYQRLTIAATALLGLVIVAVAFNHSSAIEDDESAPLEMIELPVIFAGPLGARASTDSVETDVGESELQAKQLGSRVKLFGELHDTGAINLFHASWYDGSRIVRRRYYVSERIYQQPFQSIWVTAEATISQVDEKNNDKHEIQIHAYQGLNVAEIQIIAQGLAESSDWFNSGHQPIDLNDYKGKQRFPGFISAEKLEADFNALPTRKLNEIQALDNKRGFAEFACTRYVVDEVSSHHAAYLDLVMVYDLTNKKPIRVIVEQHGFFLE
jgi:hypothetical protein